MDNISYNYHVCIKLKHKILRDMSEFAPGEANQSRLNVLVAEYNLTYASSIFLPHLFHVYLDTGNYTNKLHNLFMSLRKFNPPAKLTDAYENISSGTDAVFVKSDVCECGQKLISRGDTSEMLCIACGALETVRGIIFNEDQPQNKKLRGGAYDITNHCKIWLGHIQAHDTVCVPDRVMNTVKKGINDERIFNLEKLSCEKIRSILKVKKLSAYYINVPLIRKKITKISPPPLTDAEYQMTISYFTEFIKIYSEIKPDDKTNCSYHPFYLRKILEQVIDRTEILQMSAPYEHTHLNKIHRNDEEWEKYITTPKTCFAPASTAANELKYSGFSKRKKDILSYIHLQSPGTVAEKDIIFKKACELIPGFCYIATRIFRTIHTTI